MRIVLRCTPSESCDLSGMVCKCPCDHWCITYLGVQLFRACIHEIWKCSSLDILEPHIDPKEPYLDTSFPVVADIYFWNSDAFFSSLSAQHKKNSKKPSLSQFLHSSVKSWWFETWWSHNETCYGRAIIIVLIAESLLTLGHNQIFVRCHILPIEFKLFIIMGCFKVLT